MLAPARCPREHAAMTDPRAPQVIKAVRAALLASLAAASVAACSGGGGGGSGPSLPPPPIAPPPPAPPPPAPPPPLQPPAFYETPEYFGSGFTSTQNRSGLGQIGASTAYSQGATGQGIIVAVIDTNVDTSISELTGQLVGTHDVITNRATTDIDSDGHGTMVTSVIVANKDNVGVHGVAYEAKVLSIRADTAGSCQQTGTDQGCSFADRNTVAAIDYAIAQGAKIINMSLGGPIDNDPTLENAVRRAAAAGVLVVISAGNEGVDDNGVAQTQGKSPGEPAYIAGGAGTLGRVVAVGAVDRNGQMPNFSNRAGQTANYYLLAPGVSVIVAGVDDNIRLPNNPTCGTGVPTPCNDANTDGNYWSASGTSFAAPHVAGALALMLDLFPNITPQDALSALLDTATDYVTATPDFVSGVTAGVGADQVGGRGILNLARAFAPIGTASFTFGAEKVEVTQALAPAKGALGDWASNSGAFNGVVFQDKYLRGFRADATRMQPGRAAFSDFALRAEYARGQARAFELGPAQVSWFNAPAPVYDPRTPWAEAPDATFQFSYSVGDSRVAVGRGGGPQRLTPGITLVEDPSGPATLGSGDSWSSVSQSFGPLKFDARTSTGSGRSSNSIGFGHAADDWAVRLGYTALGDANAALGGTLQSRFGGNDETRMNAVSLEASRNVGAWTFSGALETADVQVARVNVAGLWTSSWTLSAQHPFAGGDVRLTAAQPRRAEGGTLTFDAPIEVTKSGRLIYESRTAGLTPSGRELDLEAAWVTRLGPATTFEAAAALAMQPNHVADADPETAMWLSLRHAW